MKREYWVGLIVVALVIGLVVGYGIWGTKASQVAELEGKVQQLTQENSDLRAKLPAAAGTSVATGPSEEKKQP